MVELTDEHKKDIDHRFELIKKKIEDARQKQLSFFKKDNPLYLERELAQVFLFLYELKRKDPLNPRWSKLAHDAQDTYSKDMRNRGFFIDKSGKSISGTIKKNFEKRYTIFDKNTRLVLCHVCFTPLDNHASKYCSHKCRLAAYYYRRNKVKGTQKKIVIHTHCVVCGKSIEDKRAGTKTCSMSCRKTLSMRKKVISS